MLIVTVLFSASHETYSAVDSEQAAVPIYASHASPDEPRSASDARAAACAGCVNSAARYGDSRNRGMSANFCHACSDARSGRLLGRKAGLLR